MSIQALSAAFACRGLKPAEKLVLLGLANYADDVGLCWPSQTTLADDTDLSARTIWSALQGLEKRGLIERHRRNRADGSRTSDMFVLVLPLLPTRKICEANSQDLQAQLAAVASHEPSGNRQKKPTPDGVGRKRGSRRVPDSWSPSDDLIAWATAEGLTAELIEAELPKFRDHEFRAARSDWDAAFRNWLRTSKGDRHVRTRSPGTAADPAADPRRANTNARRSAWVDVAHERERRDPGDDGQGGGDADAGVYLPRRARFG